MCQFITAEKYLSDCLSSLLNQSFPDIEVLCINDGSTDSSGDILNRFQQTDSRVKVFHQKNAGPAKARNVGLQNAQGKYLMFCDSDDTYEPDMCKEMYRAITENDVDFAMCNPNMIVMDKDHGRNQVNLNYHYNSYFGFIPLTMWLRTKINILLWNKIFKMDLVRKYNISFPDGYESDDNAFTWSYLSVSKSFYGVERKLYNYRLLNNSVMGKIYSQKKTEKLFDQVYAIKHFFNFLKANALLHNGLFLLNKTESSVRFVCSYLPHAAQMRFLALLRQEVLNNPELSTLISSHTDDYPILSACLFQNDKVALTKIHQNRSKRWFGWVKKGDKKRFYLLGLSVLKEVKTPTLKSYFICGIKVFHKKRSNIKIPHSLPKKVIKDGYILCFDCLYDAGQEAIDAYTFFTYLQHNNIPSKYVLLMDNRLADEIRDNPDVIILKNQKEFFRKCASVIQQSHAVITSFGLSKKKQNNRLKKINTLNYIFIGHGVDLLKKDVLKIYNPDRYDLQLAACHLTYDLYQSNNWDNSQILCAGLPRWDLLTKAENNGHILVFFTWRRTFKESQSAKQSYIHQVLEFLRHLRDRVPESVAIDIALHHESVRGGLSPESLNTMGINVIVTDKVSHAIRQSAMLITDYSSVCWDFMYMNKPVIFYRFDRDDLSLNLSDQEACISAMQEDRKLYNCLYDEQSVLDLTNRYIQNNFMIEPEIRDKNKTIFWENRNNCETLYHLICDKK
ncbi:MAG: glycosyltransferase [Pseudomonadota bacterium]|nr:glycosyltransferase [Pseudomonadota bacterium]